MFFGGDAALGPKNIIWAVAQGHDAAISIDKFLHGEDVRERPAPGVTLVSQKMGIHEWSYDNEVAPDARYKVPWRDVNQALRNIKVEVELGFDAEDRVEGGAALPQLRRADGVRRAAVHRVRCLRRHLPDRLHHVHRQRRGDRAARHGCARRRCNPDQALYVSTVLKTGRVMVKDEDVCLHCGLCAERCPTGAWDMQKFLLELTPAGRGCRTPHKEAA